MFRLERRLRCATLSSRLSVDPEQHRLEGALRGRAARKVRAHLRRREPVVLRTPRWSCPAGFLERVALDLAVGERDVACRSVNLRPVQGRPLPEAWRFTLQAVAQLWRSGWYGELPTVVASRTGFRLRLSQLFDDAQREARGAVALLLHGVEHLPVELIDDLSHVWERYARAHDERRVCTLLLAGGAWQEGVHLAGGVVMDLSDYGDLEAERELLVAAGPLPRRSLAALARFTGGVPSLIEALAAGIARRGAPALQADSLLASLGAMADELRGAVDIASADDDLADRLAALRDGGWAPERPALDVPLCRAGLLRRVSGLDGARVALRAPAIGALLT